MIHPLCYTLCETGPHRSFVDEKYGGTWNMWDRGGHRFHLIEYPDHLRLLWDYFHDPEDRWLGEPSVVIDVVDPTESFAIEAFKMFEGRTHHEDSLRDIR